jgi:leader peptidase (prepilin peptidase)/N-methyltransferase
VQPELASLATTPAACVLAVVLGLLWGSFANVCIYRWPPSEEHPNGRSVVAPGSHCSACKAPIRWYDNVPILSYLWLRGRCRACHVGFSPRYLLVEALTGALFGVAWWFTLGGGGMLSGSVDLRAIRFAIDAAFILCMVVITFIDIDTMLILDKVTIPAIPVFYACSLLLPERHWWDGLVGVAIGYGLPWLIGEIYLRIRKVEGMGLGDAKLLALVGALMSWRGVVCALFVGSIAGTIVELPRRLIARVRRAPADGEATLMQSELPFGPWLAIGAVFYLFAEPWLLLSFRI